MGRPRRQHQADDAAKAASEAAKVLQQRSQAAREPVEKVPEAPAEPSEDYVPPKRYSDQRTAMLEEIAASRPREEQEPAEEPKPEVKAEEPPVTERPVEAVETAPEAPVEPEMVRVKVDGEEYSVPKDEVDEAGGVRAYQIQKASENRLKKTNDVLAEIRKTQAEWMELQKQSQKPQEPEVTDDQFIAERVDKMRFGTPEESAVALREILQRSQKPAVDPNKIIEQATGKFWHDQAVKQFDQDYQDLVTNPDMLDLIVVKRNKKLAQLKGAPADWAEFYRSIGNEVRSIVGKPTSTTTTPSTTSGTPSQQSTREEKKAAAAVSVPASAARAAPPQEEKPETREDILNRMRKTRGLPVA